MCFAGKGAGLEDSSEKFDPATLEISPSMESALTGRAITR